MRSQNNSSKVNFFESPQVLVVEASAGSGKTYALARRYVQLCLLLASTQPIAIQSILAITFTNKATLAMKTRILDFLKRICLKQLQPYEIDDILKPLGLNEAEASSLAFGLMKNVIRQYHYFQVQTIDSFVNILLVGCSFKIGLSARFKIQRNSRDYLQLSLDELLDEAGRNKELRGLFEEFVRQYLFLENRTGWFPKEDLLKVTLELFKQHNTYQKPFTVYSLPENLFEHKQRIYGLIKELKGRLPAGTNKRFAGHLEDLLAADKKSFDLDELGNYWAKDDFPINKGGQVDSQLQSLWRKLTTDISTLSSQEARSIFNPYIALFDQVGSVFERLSRRDDVLFLEELNRKAGLLFDNGLVTVEELYFRLAARFNHYLVDEFQDTSVAQWRNLSLMVEEALSHGGSLFYVGDKKQAIYSFRGGESKLFDALQLQLADFNVKTLSLDHNYRSSTEIINFNNNVFSLENLGDFLERRKLDAQENKHQDIQFSDEDFELMSNTFKFAQQQQGKKLAGGVVRVDHLAGRTKQERSEEAHQRLIALIKDLSGRFAFKDMAILTRGNQELEEITQWLLQEGIAVSSERSSDIKNNPLITEIIWLLSFLYSPIDNNAFAQFCLGQLMSKATGIDPQVLRDFLFKCARQSKQVKEHYFYKEFREAFPKEWEVFFEDSFRQVGLIPLYELTVRIIHRFGCEKFFGQYQGFLMHLLELIKDQEKESCDLSAFLEFYANFEGEGRFVPMPDVDAVKVLTVHKAKGLEFPVVIIPFLEMEIKAGSGGRDGAQAFVLDVGQEFLSLVRLKESYRRFSPSLQERYAQEYKKSFLGELNSIYVALTRAIEELYIFVPVKVGNSVNPAKYLIPENCLILGTPTRRPAEDKVLAKHHQIKAFVSDPWKGLTEEFLREPPKSAALAHHGEFYHAVLMHIDRINESNIEGVLKEAWDKASRLFTNQPNILNDIRFFINRPDVRRYFYLPADAQVFCEKEFVNKYGDTRRIDRLIVIKDEVWIVDFKLSEGAQAAHQKQMDGYIELIKQFYPKANVSGHILYFHSI